MLKKRDWSVCVVCKHDEQSHLAVTVENQATYIACLGVLFISDISVLLSLDVKKRLKYQQRVSFLDIPEAAPIVNRLFLAQEVRVLPTSKL